MIPGCSSLQEDIFQTRGPCNYSVVGPRGYTAPLRVGRTNDDWGGDGSSPRTRYPSTEMGNQVRGVDHHVAVNGERDGSRGSGVAQFPLPTIWHRSPRPPSSLWWLKIKFSIYHALDYEKGGLITIRHNELFDWVSDLEDKAFNPSHVCDYPLVYLGCAMR